MADLLEMMQADAQSMQMISLALTFQVIGKCAVPIFAFFLVEGAVNTTNFSRYLFRVTGLAFLTEIPYDLLMNGSPLFGAGLNPVYAMAIGLIMLYFFRRYNGKNIGHSVIKIAVFLAAIAWTMLLGMEDGTYSVILAAVLWMLQGKANLRIFGGAMVSLCCCFLSLYYLAAPASFLILYFYDGQKGHGSKLVNYICYPIMLLLFWCIACFLL